MSILSMHDPMAVRRRGLLHFLVGLGVFAIALTLPLFILPRYSIQLTPEGMIPVALPGAYALTGLVELVTGVSFLEFARRWDSLKGWQRGIFGTFIVLVAGSLIITAFAYFAYLTSH